MPGKNKQLFRYLEKEIVKLLDKKQSLLLLGPRQTGKTTLIKKIIKNRKNVLEYPLQNPSLRINLEADPSKIIREVEAEKNIQLVFIDEAQKVPELFDSAQYLIDNKKAIFIFTGSSARKLRRSGANLLAGRIRRFFLPSLLWGELGWQKKSVLPTLAMQNLNKNINYSFFDSLIYGSLPNIVCQPAAEREGVLRAYAEIYLEEEIRAEALSRKIGAFSRFLELAAAESGTSPNYTKLSNESGVSQPAIKEYYQILEDTLIVEKVEPFLRNARKRILASPRYYFFDLGVRNALARLPLTKGTINAQKGILFEHAVMLEIIRRIKVLGKNYRVNYWRTAGGAEVDCIIDLGKEVIPIEIKASRNVALSDIKGLKNFLTDYKNIAKQGYVVTLGERKERLAKNIIALPWFYL